MPQSVILYVLMQCLLILIVPFVLVSKFALTLGKNCGCSIGDSADLGYPGYVFFYGIFLLPIVLVPSLIMLPIVLLYRVYVVLSIVVRHFLLCCCC